MRPGTIPDRTGGILLTGAAALAAAGITGARVAAATRPIGGHDLLPAQIPFSTTVETISQLGARADGALLGWLVLAGWATWAVGMVSLLALWADRAARTRAEIAVHRAVGASRGALISGAIREGLALATVALTLGVTAGVLAARALGAPRPAGGATTIIPVVLGTGTVLLLGAVLPLWGARSRRAVGIEAAPTPLGIAAIQLGASLSLVVAGAMVSEHGRTAATQGGSGALDPRAEVYQVAATRGGPLDLAAMVDRSRAAGVPISISMPGGHLGRGPVDRMTTECGQCLVGTIFLRWRPLRATYLTATADTFRARGIPIVQGRGFSDQDRAGAPMVAIVNRQLAHRYFERGQPLGRKVILGGTMAGTPYEVVGVVDDPPPTGAGGTLQPRETIYLSALQHPGVTAEVLVPAGRGAPSGIGVRVTRRMGADLLIQEALAPGQRLGRWFQLQGWLALLLALAGTSALLVLWVRSLRHEIALRRAVGARQADLVRLVLRRATRTGVVGIAIGVGFFGVGLWPELGRLVPGIPAWDTAQVVWAASLLLAATLVAALVPLRLLRRSTPATLLSRR